NVRPDGARSSDASAASHRCGIVGSREASPRPQGGAAVCGTRMTAVTANDTCIGRSRLLLDVTALIRWVGPPVGIVRVEAELVRYAMERRPDIEFVVYDSRVHDYRLVKRHLVPQMLAGDLFVDHTGIPDPRSVPRSRVGAFLNRCDHQLIYLRRPR